MRTFHIHVHTHARALLYITSQFIPGIIFFCLHNSEVVYHHTHISYSRIHTRGRACTSRTIYTRDYFYFVIHSSEIASSHAHFMKTYTHTRACACLVLCCPVLSCPVSARRRPPHPQAIALPGLPQHVAHQQRRQLRRCRWRRRQRRHRGVGADRSGAAGRVRLLEGTPGSQKRGGR